MKNTSFFPFERNKYYYGKLLSVEDFNLEQKYVNDKRRMINRLIDGTGIVAGMNVVGLDERTISVERGFALDCVGREIVIDNPIIKKLSLIENFDSCVKTNANYMYLCIEYDEKEKAAVHNIAGSSSQDDVAYNKIRESYRLFLTNDEPDAEVLRAEDLFEETKVVYWDGNVRIKQVMPRYVKPGSRFEMRVEVENYNKQAVAFSYDLQLTCLTCDNRPTLKVEFDEVTYEKTGQYSVAYTLDALDVVDTDGVAEIDPSSFRLMVGKKRLDAKAEQKSVTAITVGDSIDEMVKRYYGLSMDAVLRSNYMQNLYLAKICLIKAGDTYVIENIENVPFGQYVMNSTLSTAIQKLLAKQSPAAGVANLSVPLNPGEKITPLRRDIASGVCRIDLGIGGQKKERFFSDEIIHGLGLGSVTIILSVSNPNEVTFGSSEVFENENPCVEVAAKLNPAKGTFVIGARLIATTTKTSVDVKWTAIRDMEEIIAEKTKMKIFVKPNSLTLKTRESYYLEAVCSNMPDKTVQWSVAENGGMIDSNGMYVAPNEPGVYEVLVQSVMYPEVKASIMVVVRE